MEKVKIVLDNGIAFVLYKGDLLKFNIVSNMESMKLNKDEQIEYLKKYSYDFDLYSFFYIQLTYFTLIVVTF